MDLSFRLNLAMNYNNPAQRIRVLTEDWVQQNGYCPNCGHEKIKRYKSNIPVADFYCENCGEDYELKSKLLSFNNRIVDGAYRTMMERLRSTKNPNFLFLNYNNYIDSVVQFLTIPKHFFTPRMIERRNPLASTARRAGWVGCDILINSIPQTGKIFIVRNQKIEPKKKVLIEWQKTLFLKYEKGTSAKGWLLDTMRCIEKIGNKEFTLDDVYLYQNELNRLHPENKHVKDKIRQQLQVLRDKRYLSFVAPGHYRIS